MISAEDALKESADGIARIAVMRAGWEGAIDKFLSLVEDKKTANIDPGYKDMSQD